MKNENGAKSCLLPLVINRYLTWAEDWLRDASPEQLETWAERLLAASRLEEVFEASGRH